MSNKTKRRFKKKEKLVRVNRSYFLGARNNFKLACFLREKFISSSNSAPRSVSSGPKSGSSKDVLEVLARLRKVETNACAAIKPSEALLDVIVVLEICFIVIKKYNCYALCFSKILSYF